MDARSKKCRRCGGTKPLEEMALLRKPGGQVYHRSWCKMCDGERTQKWRIRAPQRARLSLERANSKKRTERKEGFLAFKYIYQDSRAADCKHGRLNDLTYDFVRETIEKGCCYCGETEIRMTLDRIDNNKGHTQDNVVPACIRCNYTRKNMPYEAWLVVAKGMQEAKERQLFGTWTGRTR